LPQSVYRYNDTASGLIDGSLFLMVYGNNPEIALLIESRRDGSGKPAWYYGIQRIAGAQLHVELDDKEIADIPKYVEIGLVHPYGTVVIPAEESGK
jgi:hypothetical protein